MKTKALAEALKEMIRVFSAYAEFPVEVKAVAAAKKALKETK